MQHPEASMVNGWEGGTWGALWLWHHQVQLRASSQWGAPKFFLCPQPTCHKYLANYQLIGPYKSKILVGPFTALFVFQYTTEYWTYFIPLITLQKGYQ